MFNTLCDLCTFLLIEFNFRQAEKNVLHFKFSTSSAGELLIINISIIKKMFSVVFCCTAVHEIVNKQLNGLKHFDKKSKPISLIELNLWISTFGGIDFFSLSLVDFESFLEEKTL